MTDAAVPVADVPPARLAPADDPRAVLPALPFPAKPPEPVAATFWDEVAQGAPQVVLVTCIAGGLASVLALAGDFGDLPPASRTAGLALRAASILAFLAGLPTALRAKAFVRRHHRALFSAAFWVVAVPVGANGRWAGRAAGDLYWMGILEVLLATSTFFSLPTWQYLANAGGITAFYLLCRLAGTGVPFDSGDFNVVEGLAIFGLLAAVTHLVVLRGRQASHDQRRLLYLQHEQKAAILSSIGDAFFVLDAAWCVVFLNDEAERLMAHLRPRGALRGKVLWEEFPGLRDSLMFDRFHQAVAEHVPVQYEEYYPLLDRHVVVKAFPARDGLSVYFHDVTELKRTQHALEEARDLLEQRVEERTRDLRVAKVHLEREVEERRAVQGRLQSSLDEKEVLLREVHHRGKNNLQVLASLLRLQGAEARTEDERRSLRANELRIRSMALVHEKLYRAPDLARVDLGAYLHDLVGQLVPAWSARPVHLAVDTEEALVGIDTAVACGLLANELVSNALRHAVASAAEPRIRVGLRRLDPGPDPLLELHVGDNGPGLPPGFDPARTGTLGLQLVHTIAKTQLGGEVAAESSAAGLDVRIRFRERR